MLHINIDFNVENPLWDLKLPNSEATCMKAVKATLDYLKCTGDIEISITLADDTHIQTLNRDYRNKDVATNVLSFPLETILPQEIHTLCQKYEAAKQPLMLGDIILSLDTIACEAETQGKNFLNHLTHLIVHATLHLLGYDHIENSEAENMENSEKEILATLGISDPYLL